LKNSKNGEMRFVKSTKYLIMLINYLLLFFYYFTS